MRNPRFFRYVSILLLVASCTIFAVDLPSGSVSDAGNATISGSNGYNQRSRASGPNQVALDQVMVTNPTF